jgi:hypothetical protein
MKERRCTDAQEVLAMLNHRLRSIAYVWQQLTQPDSIARYAFRSFDGTESILLLDVANSDVADYFIKRDPQFPYCSIEVIPVVNTEALVREAQDFLGEEIFNEEDLPNLNFPIKPINDSAQYWLAHKEVLPFSPLLQESEQNEIFRRTILAQRGHLKPIEFSDHNPVGRQIGILIAEGNYDAIRTHVEDCEVFPDTVVTYTELNTLRNAWDSSVKQIKSLRRDNHLTSPFTDASRVQ